MSFGMNGSMACNVDFTRNICNFIGETVTIFTASGGLSGCGFTGVVLCVSNDFVRLVTQQSSAPTCPISDICGGGCGDGPTRESSGNQSGNWHKHEVGSVCDIPICMIVSFCHNAV